MGPAHRRHADPANLIGEMMHVSRLDSRTNGTLLPGRSLTSLDGGATLVNDPELGPVLRDASTAKPLWQALGPGSADLPARLIMQDDGDLVLRDRFSCVIWSSGTADPAGAPSTLSLEGSIGDGNLRLMVHDYANGRTTATLYP